MAKSGGRDRNPGGDEHVPAEGGKREAQDRSKPRGGAGGAESPVDSMHVDAPKKQDNARGHAQERGLKGTKPR
jgi:hypothetical protein